MTDGPHRTLKMKSHWKDVAKKAELAAFSLEEIREAINTAVSKDWRKSCPELMTEIRRLCLHLQRPLLGNPLEDLRFRAEGTPLWICLLECLQIEMARGSAGEEALINAVSASLSEWITRHFRQIEEHYLLETDRNSTDQVLNRLWKSEELLQIDALSKKLVSSSHSEKPVGCAKVQGLDDGPVLVQEVSPV